MKNPGVWIGTTLFLGTFLTGLIAALTVDGGDPDDLIYFSQGQIFFMFAVIGLLATAALVLLIALALFVASRLRRILH